MTTDEQKDERSMAAARIIGRVQEWIYQGILTEGRAERVQKDIDTWEATFRVSLPPQFVADPEATASQPSGSAAGTI